MKKIMFRWNTKTDLTHVKYSTKQMALYWKKIYSNLIRYKKKFNKYILCLPFGKGYNVQSLILPETFYNIRD